MTNDSDRLKDIFGKLLTLELVEGCMGFNWIIEESSDETK